jgi:hypothetical protein
VGWLTRRSSGRLRRRLAPATLGGQVSLFRIVLRTPEEKADLEGCWARSDEDFFGSGGCHVLAAAFLEARPHLRFRALMIQPAQGFRGGHVVVASATVVFDCRGWSLRDQFMQSYSEAMCRLSPGWSYTLLEIDNPIAWEFCREHEHRHPSQFFRDPMARARAFLSRFPPRPEMLPG